MGSKSIGIFFRLIMVVTIICALVIFLTDFKSAEFYITLFSLILGAGMSVVSALLLRKAVRREHEDKYGRELEKHERKK